MIQRMGRTGRAREGKVVIFIVRGTSDMTKFKYVASVFYLTEPALIDTPFQ